MNSSATSFFNYFKKYKNKSINLKTCLLLGTIVLIVSNLFLFQQISHSDEIEYALTARNIAFKGEISSNLYITESIIKNGGFDRPLHMPGFSTLVAVFFKIFGVNDYIALLPNFLLYLTSIAIFYFLSKELLDKNIKARNLSIVLFILFPVFWLYTNMVMTEISIVFLCLLFFYLLIKLKNNYTKPIILAVILIIGMFFRETFGLLLWPVIGSLCIYNKENRLRNIIIFSLVFLALFFIFFLPIFSADRQIYPNTFNFINSEDTAYKKLWDLKENFLFNFNKATTLRIINSEDLLKFSYWLIAFFALLSYNKYCNEKQKRFFWLFFPIFMINILLLFLFYSVLNRIETRVLLWFIPLLLVYFSIFLENYLSKLNNKETEKMVLISGLFIIFLSVDIISVIQMKNKIEREYKEQSLISQMIDKNIEAYNPQVIVSPYTFLYAWQNYPIKIIWHPPKNIEELKKLEKIIKIDFFIFSKNCDMIFLEETNLKKFSYCEIPYKNKILEYLDIQNYLLNNPDKYSLLATDEATFDYTKYEKCNQKFYFFKVNKK